MQLRNITFMSPDPGRLADFYAAVLDLPGRKVNPSGEVIVHDGEWGFPRLTFQPVDEARSAAPSPIHLDLTPPGGRVAAVARLKELGATEGETHHEDGFRWTVVRDPDGNELCITD